ncbi:MAG TPA: protein kinase [Bryobacteraceae bacterium]|nr:protein kinase [Bryobacteraceae bacterium]
MTPQPDRLDRANQLFSDALELTASERPSYVQRECAGDADLCGSVLKLLARFENLGSFLETPAGGYSELSPGDMLDSRFRILELLGRGGMGEVYRAEDLTLGEPVALKMVRAEWRSDPAMLARFRDEVRLARRISHPNVCRVFGFRTCSVNGRDLAFFEMEYIDGDSLAKAISARGKFDAASVLRIAAGIAAGLDAAHREGVIHRDLKPGNIFLASDRHGNDRPVIADFGLARSVEGVDGARTQSGMLAGSPDYMAPEQYLGEPPTTAVDIFAFGLIVYEMAAGRRPYPPESIVRSAVRRIMEEPPPLSRAAPDCPKHWDHALTHALARDPGRRFASATALLRELEERPSAVTAAFSAVRAPKFSRRSWLVASGAAVVASFLGALRLYKRRLPDAPLIMLTPLKSANPDNAAALDLQIEKGLLQSAYVRVLDTGRIHQAWKLMGRTTAFPAELETRDAREIALREGAQFVLFGNLEKVADEWVMSLRLELLGDSPAYPRDKFPKSFPAEGTQDLLSAAARAVTWVRGTTGESADLVNAHSRAPEAITTKSWEALKEYTQADTAWRARELDGRWVEDKRGDAEVHLNRALELDPGFAQAAARLADIQTASDQIDEGYANYQRAAAIIDANDLTDRESLLTRGLFAFDTGQYAKAQEVFARYALEYPHDGLPLFHEAACIEHRGNLPAALHLIEQAIELDPTVYSFVMARANYLLSLGRFADAESQCEKAAKLYNNDWTDQMRAALAFARLDIPGVWRSLERMKTVGTVHYRSNAFTLEACLRAEQNRWDESESLLNEGIAFDTENNQPPEAGAAKQRALALVYIHQRRLDEAISGCNRVLAKKQGTRSVLEFGALLARAGDVEGARRCIPKGLPQDPPDRPPSALPPGARKELLEWPLYWRRVLLLWAEMALTLGDGTRAYALLLNAPAPEKTQEWQTRLVRASILSGERDTAERLLRALLANPAAYWLMADTAGPGFFREAIAEAEAFKDSLGNWASWKRIL